MQDEVTARAERDGVGRGVVAVTQVVVGRTQLVDRLRVVVIALKGRSVHEPIIAAGNDLPPNARDATELQNAAAFNLDIAGASAVQHRALCLVLIDIEIECGKLTRRSADVQGVVASVGGV